MFTLDDKANTRTLSIRRKKNSIRDPATLAARKSLGYDASVGECWRASARTDEHLRESFNSGKVTRNSVRQNKLFK